MYLCAAKISNTLNFDRSKFIMCDECNVQLTDAIHLHINKY